LIGDAFMVLVAYEREMARGTCLADGFNLLLEAARKLGARRVVVESCIPTARVAPILTQLGFRSIEAAAGFLAGLPVTPTKATHSRFSRFRNAPEREFHPAAAYDSPEVSPMKSLLSVVLAFLMTCAVGAQVKVGDKAVWPESEGSRLHQDEIAERGQGQTRPARVLRLLVRPLRIGHAPPRIS
jgi:hypothetical protein